MNERRSYPRRLMAAVAVAAVLGALPTSVTADAVSECGAAQGKILGAYFKALVGESTKACVTGSPHAPQPVDTTKLTALVDKLNADIQGTIDKFGDANCFYKANTDAGTQVSQAQTIANELCLVPSPTPTP